MKETFTNLSASELFATEIGVSGVPLPSYGIGRKNPTLKYAILAGILIGTGTLAYYAYKYHIKQKNIQNNEK